MTGKPDSFAGNCRGIANACPGTSSDHRGIKDVTLTTRQTGGLHPHSEAVEIQPRWEGRASPPRRSGGPAGCGAESRGKRYPAGLHRETPQGYIYRHSYFAAFEFTTGG